MGEFLEFPYKDFRYKLYIPSSYSRERELPLMVMLHGCDQNPDDFAAGTKMNALAEKENFLVLYPDMNHLFNPSNPDSYNPFGCWNWFLDKNQHRGKGHPKLINGIIDEVKSNYMVDSTRVYAAGLSAGASLACILGVTYPDVFSGIGICAGLAYDAANVVFFTDPMAEAAKKSMLHGVDDPYECGNSAFLEMGEFKKKMPVIVFHGISDTVVHPINGQQVIIQWSQTNYLIEEGIGKAEVAPIDVKSEFINGKSCTRHIYGESTELWMIDEMGHAWPGGSTEGSYTDPSGPNATEIIWNFFLRNQPEMENAEDAILVTTKNSAEENVLEALTSSELTSGVRISLVKKAIDVEPDDNHDNATAEEPIQFINSNEVDEGTGEDASKPVHTMNSFSTEDAPITAENEPAEERPSEIPKKKMGFIRSLIMKFFRKRH